MRRWGWGAAGAIGLAALGLGWRDCLLIAASAVLVQRLFIARLDAAAPWDGWRAALHCIEAGLVGLALAAGVGALGTTALLGLWHPAHPHPLLAAALMLAAGVGPMALQPARPRLGREAGLWGTIVAMVLLVTWLEGQGVPAAPCVFVLGLAALLAHSSWRLAHDTASALMHSQRRLH